MSTVPDGFVTIARYLNPLDAEMARIRLDAEEIPVYLADVNTTAINPLYGAAVGVRLQVPSELSKQAIEILASEPEQELSSEAVQWGEAWLTARGF